MSVLLGLTFFAIGVGSQVMLFRHGEWNLFTYKFNFLHINLIQVMLIVGVHLADPQDGWFREMSTAFWLEASFVSGVFTSTIVYRAFIHSLTRHGFPGPFVVRLSQFYQTALGCKRLRLFDASEVGVLHKKYGDFVRTGPQRYRLQIPKPWSPFMVPIRRLCYARKGYGYDMLHPKVTLQATRDHRIYSQKRKLWDQAFSSKGQYYD